MALDHLDKEFTKYEENRKNIEGAEAVSDFDKLVKVLPSSKK